MKLIVSNYAYIVNDEPIQDGDRCISEFGNFYKEGVKKGFKIIASDNPTLNLPDVRFDLSYNEISSMITRAFGMIGTRPFLSTSNYNDLFDSLSYDVKILESGTYVVYSNIKWKHFHDLLPEFNEVVKVLCYGGKKDEAYLKSIYTSKSEIKHTWINNDDKEVSVEYWDYIPKPLRYERTRG